MNEAPGYLKRISRTISPFRLVAFGTCLAATMLFTACGVYVPEGSTVFKVTNSRIEYDRAEIQPQDELRKREIVRLRWYDENTYITTATFTPGIYTFRTRSYTGGGLARDVQILPDVNVYEINAGSAPVKSDGSGDSEMAGAGGPAIKGQIAPSRGQRRISTLSVLFIGESIEMRTAEVAADGSFETRAPGKGPWRIEIHATGRPPLSYVRQVENVAADLNLGKITLQ